MKGYTKADPKIDISEKEHVLVALKIKIGARYGILLLDPGYHIGRVITIMKDQFYPNTGTTPTTILLSRFFFFHFSPR